MGLAYTRVVASRWRDEVVAGVTPFPSAGQRMLDACQTERQTG